MTEPENERRFDLDSTVIRFARREWSVSDLIKVVLLFGAAGVCAIFGATVSQGFYLATITFSLFAVLLLFSAG